MLVVDTLNGLERLCHEYVCKRDFGGRWGKDGFLAYMQGYEMALADWKLMLAGLDRLRNERKMGVILLGHSRVATYKNPEGADYDRYVCDVHTKTWSLTHKWADLVIFTNYETFVESDRSSKPKGRGGSRRAMFTERCASWDAKNRFGLPPKIDCGGSAREAWNNLCSAMAAAKAASPYGNHSAANGPPPATAAHDVTEPAGEADDTEAAPETQEAHP
jgi:hypothetical protein